MIDIWMLFTMIIPFLEVVILAFRQGRKVKPAGPEEGDRGKKANSTYLSLAWTVSTSGRLTNLCNLLVDWGLTAGV